MVKQKKTFEPQIDQVELRALGRRIEAARRYAGLTQAQVVDGRFSKSFASLLETGRSSPSIATLQHLAGRLGASLNTLLMPATDIRLDTTLALASLAREAAWSRPTLARRLTETMVTLVPGLPLWLKADVALIRAIAAETENRLVEARGSANAALQIARQARSGAGQARALTILGHVAYLRRDLERAFALLTRAVAQHRQSKSLRTDLGIRALLWLGSVAIRRGHSRMGHANYRRALDLARSEGFPGLEGQAWMGLGFFHWTQGDLGQAIAAFHEARPLFEEVEDLLNLSRLLSNLGTVLRERGKIREAADALKRAARLETQLQDYRGRSAVHEELARVYVQAGDTGRALESARQALADARRMSDRQHEALALATLGRCKAKAGDKRWAVGYLRQAISYLKKFGPKAEAAEAVRDLELITKGTGITFDAYLAQASVDARGRRRSR